MTCINLALLLWPLVGWVTGLTTEPQKTEAGPGDEVRMSKETQSKVEALRYPLYVLLPWMYLTYYVICSEVSYIVPFQGGAGAAAGQSPAGPWAVPADLPVEHSCLCCARLQHQWQVHPLPGRCQLQPHSGGADCHRQSAAPGLFVNKAGVSVSQCMNHSVNPMMQT